jgi:anti-anti-sigma regulatory factor
VRLTFPGEPDITTVGQLDQSASQLASGALSVRVDLFQLRFIDECGFRAVARPVELANNRAARFQIDPRVGRAG